MNLLIFIFILLLIMSISVKKLGSAEFEKIKNCKFRDAGILLECAILSKNLDNGLHKTLDLPDYKKELKNSISKNHFEMVKYKYKNNVLVSNEIGSFISIKEFLTRHKIKKEKIIIFCFNDYLTNKFPEYNISFIIDPKQYNGEEADVLINFNIIWSEDFSEEGFYNSSLVQYEYACWLIETARPKFALTLLYGPSYSGVNVKIPAGNLYIMPFSYFGLNPFFVVDGTNIKCQDISDISARVIIFNICQRNLDYGDCVYDSYIAKKHNINNIPQGTDVKCWKLEYGKYFNISYSDDYLEFIRMKIPRLKELIYIDENYLKGRILFFILEKLNASHKIVFVNNYDIVTKKYINYFSIEKSSGWNYSNEIIILDNNEEIFKEIKKKKLTYIPNDYITDEVINIGAELIKNITGITKFKQIFCGNELYKQIIKKAFPKIKIVNDQNKNILIWI